MSTAITIEDFAAICRVKARYCRFLDDKDWPAFSELFTEDFELDTSAVGGPPTIRGREAAVESVATALATAKTAHQVHLPEITLDGDTAEVIWAMQDRVVWDAARAAELGTGGHTGYGRYYERYRRHAGGWRIAALRLRYLIYEPIALG